MRRLLPSLRSSLLALVAVGFLSACGQNAWGPKCVLPADVAAEGGGYEYFATTEGWVNTGISVMKDDLLDGKATGKMLLCPATSTTTSIAVDARTSSWTSTGMSVRRGDSLYLTIGEPNAAGGPAGNKWSTWSGSAGNPDPWDPAKDTKTNDVCRPGNGAPCWDIYGSDVFYGNGGGLQVRFGGEVHSVNEANLKFNGNVAFENVPQDGNVDMRITDTDYSDNQGGFTIALEKVACKRKDGEALAMRIVQPGQNVADATVEKQMSPAFSSYNVPVNGTIWLKLTDTVAAGADGIYNSNTGSYTVAFTSKIPDNSPKTTIVSQALNTVVVFLQETLQETQRLFFTGLLGGDFGKALRAALVLYIIFYAMAFTFGMVQTPQLDFVKRLVKFAIVVQLLNPNTGWTFFNEHLFIVFNQGPAWLIHVFNNLETGTIPPFNPEEGINWTFLDKTVGQFISQTFWIKTSSLIFSGPLGIVYFFSIILGAVIFTKAVLHAILIYIMSLLTMTLLIAIAPLFIAFSLFKLTEELFESWLKTCVEYFLRPVFAFAVLTIFNFIMIALLLRILGFGACWKCLLAFDLGISIVPKLCLLYFWQPEGYDSQSPLPGVYLPVSLFELLTYLVVANLTTTMIRFSESQVSAIAGSTRGFGLSGKAKAIANDMKKPFGMDKEGIKERKGRNDKAAADKKADKKRTNPDTSGKGSAGTGTGTGTGSGTGTGASGSGAGNAASASGKAVPPTPPPFPDRLKAKNNPPAVPPKPAHMKAAPMPGTKGSPPALPPKPGSGAKTTTKMPSPAPIPPRPGAKPAVPPKPDSLKNRPKPGGGNPGSGGGSKNPPPVPPKPKKP